MIVFLTQKFETQRVFWTGENIHAKWVARIERSDQLFCQGLQMYNLRS